MVELICFFWIPFIIYFFWVFYDETPKVKVGDIVEYSHELDRTWGMRFWSGRGIVLYSKPWRIIILKYDKDGDTEIHTIELPDKKELKRWTFVHLSSL